MTTKETKKTVETNRFEIAKVTGLTVEFINEVTTFCHGGNTEQSWEVVENILKSGKVFAAIQKNAPRDKRVAMTNYVAGKNVNKNNRSCSIKLWEADYNLLKAWYFHVKCTKTSPTTLWAAFDKRDDEKTPKTVKSDKEKIQELILNLSKKLKKAALNEIEAAAIGSSLLDLTNIDLTIEVIEKKVA